MKVCILLQAPREEGQETGLPSPGLYVSDHTFEHRFIDCENIQAELSPTVGENYDLYMNFLPWHLQGSDNIATVNFAGIYVESLGAPVIGIPSQILDSCRTNPSSNILHQNFTSEQGEDLGDEYACMVVELIDTPVALSPVLRRSGTILKSSSNSSLYNSIRRLAEETFSTRNLHGCPWCTILICATNDGNLALTGINLLPQIFLPSTGQPSSIEDYTIRTSFPGSYRAFINSLIASCFLKRESSLETPQDIGQEYDKVAPNYDAVTSGIYHDHVGKIVTKYNYDGLVLDLACGTGFVARFNGEAQGLKAGDNSNASKFIGIEVSAQMRTECLRHGWYKKILLGPIQRVLVAYTNPVDHITCIGALHYLDTNELSLVLSRAFQLASCSVTFTVDEITDSYKSAQSLRGLAHMGGLNHLGEVEAYGTPEGWKLADRWRHLGWNSPSTGHEIYTSIFRFERLA
ncbi:hypothetical protein DRE_00414 [Drechslerella stenobrocha 248]|uniref:Methyltransferase domain-containing protein n=1 Tax=Drechslerella stenobrocha 248 TaxID=1043628 RepID=W7HTJ7_9PEZI|nr:hypothetical protein DRE_00414 [Drechslerella stenobrocha 248]